MTKTDKTAPVTMQELLVSSLAQVDALAKLLIEKGLITRDEFMQKISEERATYQKTVQSYAAMTIGEMLIRESLTGSCYSDRELGVLLKIVRAGGSTRARVSKSQPTKGKPKPFRFLRDLKGETWDFSRRRDCDGPGRQPAQF
jgi:hypothetical protein